MIFRNKTKQKETSPSSIPKEMGPRIAVPLCSAGSRNEIYANCPVDLFAPAGPANIPSTFLRPGFINGILSGRPIYLITPLLCSLQNRTHWRLGDRRVFLICAENVSPHFYMHKLID